MTAPPNAYGSRHERRHRHGRRAAGLRRALAASLLVALACATGQQSDVDAPARIPPTATADDLLIVDCLLPGQVRKLGGRVTYLTPRRPVKTNAIDCEIRGGEYTAYDRANYETSLAVWLPAAEQGDPRAQNYVGEIYERGLGRAPDYAAAAHWYRRAAEQEFGPAQINLGQLYEQGLGVEASVEEALRWYALASGLEDPQFELVPSSELVALRQELEASTAAAESLRGALSEVRRQLGAAQTRRATHESEASSALQALAAERSALAEERRRITAERARLAATSAAVQERLESGREETADAEALVARRASLDAREAELARRATTLAAGEATLAATRHRLQLEKDRVASQRDALLSSEARLHATESQLAAARTELDAARSALADREYQLLARQTALHEEAARLAADQRHVAQERGEIEAVEVARSELQAYEASLAQRERALAQSARHIEARAADLDLAEQAMAQKRREIAALSAEIARLRSESEAQRQQLARLAEQRTVPMAGPSIQMLDPLIVAARARDDLRQVRTAADVTERIVVGRVEAPAGLLSLTINDLVVPSDSRGMFSRNIRIEPGGTPVEIVAVDRQGERADLRFLLLADEPAEELALPEVAARPPAIPPGIDFGRYFALVIGNDDYAHLPRLESAVSDADAVGEVLERRYGFQVTSLRNATRYQILSALNGLTSTLTREDNLLVYYAGHGELDRVNQVGHWLPVDAEPNSPANWLSTRSLTDQLNRVKARHVLVVADSCYSGALTRAGVTQLRSGETEDERLGWIRAQLGLRVRMALTSGGLKPVLDSGAGKHSVFARFFIEVLQANDGVLDGMSLYQAIAAKVVEAAKENDFEQVPEYAPIRHGHHENGHFLFVARA